MSTFPTGKENVSYSEVRMWKECGWRHKLAKIDGIVVDEYEESVYTEFGTVIHDACETFLEHRTIDIPAVHAELDKRWEKYGFDTPEWIKQFTDKAAWDYKHEFLPFWKSSAEVILGDLEKFMDENFNDWEFVAAEFPLWESIGDTGIYFKGFIDGIIKDTTKKGKDRIWIIDWKTAGPGGWFKDKRRDFLTHAQIVLYKSYWSRKLGVDPRDIQTAFVLLKRGAKPGKSIDLFRVSSGPKTLEKGDKLVSSMISTVRKGMFLKNRNSCKFCEFYQTEHCK
jgi:hypothetical protein